MPILELDGIHTYYGDSHVLHGLSMELEAGKILGVLGRNGVGKTTMVSSVVGFNPPRRGSILFKGEDITRTNSYEIIRKGIGLVPQGRRLFGSLSVEENLKVAALGKGRREWTVERVFGLFERLRERRRQRARTLSGGEQQMLAIGRGLMTNPDCLIMDEPTEGLAPMVAHHVRDVIRFLRNEGLAVLLVEQNATLALELVDHVLVMSKGQIVHSSSPEELSANQAVKAQYLGV